MYEKLIRTFLIVAAFGGLGLLYACSSATWEDAQRADSYEAYQAYIEANPEGEHIAEARKRADSRYWNSIKNDSTAQVFKGYLEKFPGGQFRSEAQTKINQLSAKTSNGTKGRVTGSNVIIRSDHTTESPSAGVVAREGTIVQILDQYSAGNSSEAILKRDVTVVKNGDRIELSGGKAVRILADYSDSVRAAFTISGYGAMEAKISKKDIEAISGQKWYKIHTRDGITGWIYGKFIEEM